MMQGNTEGLSEYTAQELMPPKKRGLPSLFARPLPEFDRSAVTYFGSTALYRLGSSPEKYAPLLRKKDLRHIGPIVRYFVGSSGHGVFLGGDAVTNFCRLGKKKYKAINILAFLTTGEIEKYAFVMNNIISSSDGAFAMGFRYRVRKNRQAGCFSEVAVARYVIEPRYEGLSKLRYPFRPASIELDLVTADRFYTAEADTRQP